jgi:hypothetical protein
MMLWIGGALGSTVHRERCTRHYGAWELTGSSRRGRGRGGGAEGCSLEHGQRPRGDATEVKSGYDLSSVWERGRARESSKERAEGAAFLRGGVLTFYRG